MRFSKGARALVVLSLVASGCGASVSEPAPSPAPADPLPARGTPAPVVPEEPQEAVTESEAGGHEIRYWVENRTDIADAVETIHAILTDPRGWSRAGFDFVLDERAPYRVVLAEGHEVDELCFPYQTWSTYSCQNGPVVALNADRWREATPSWLAPRAGTEPADLDGYRVMLVNHEVGHLLHLHHPDPQCPGPGLPAPVMTQQSTSLGECLPNPWPLQWEIDLAAQRLEPLAPPADHDPSDHRPAPPPASE